MIFKKEIVLNSKLSTEQIAERLRMIIDKKRMFSNWSNSHYEFEGYIRDRDFRISRIIWGRNSFIPTIYGLITDFKDGTRVQLTFQLNTLVKIFLTASILFWIIIGSIMSLVLNFIDNFFLKIWMIPIPIIIIISIGLILFNYECKKATKIINELIIKRNANPR